MRQSQFSSVMWFSITGLVTACIAIGFSLLISKDYSLSMINYYCMVTSAVSGALIGLLIDYIRKKKSTASPSFSKRLLLGFAYTALGYIIDCVFIAVFFSNQFDDFFSAFFSIVLVVPFIVFVYYGGWIAFITGPLSYILYISHRQIIFNSKELNHG